MSSVKRQIEEGFEEAAAYARVKDNNGYVKDEVKSFIRQALVIGFNQSSLAFNKELEFKLSNEIINNLTEEIL